ncbi:nucleotide-binding universal stress UspA family protein [Weissella beninensis]|uniref:Universal stress protein n=1 Tax=Periweissella beninensis TaxID=504936 RepID=A0ABT0VJ51_9LACO|nr:universal stress protein [Periweissella beninensis]MBM7544454.1 nucleotide-binding universal stress UspA family protein [Periweissella beninensis]MCM2437861.1 universal stress protein [Periweissella beninensis]
MDYQKILVGVDGSQQAKAAFEKAVAIARRNNSALVIASVLNVDKYVGTSIGLGKAYINEAVENDLIADLQKLVDGYVQTARTMGVANVEGDVVRGNSKIALAESLVDKHNIDLVVIGATGTNFVSRILIGSNTQYVVQNGTVDTLVVRAPNTVK